MAPPEEGEGHGGAELKRCSSKKAQETEKLRSVEENGTPLGVEQNEGASTAKKKRRKDWRAFANESNSGSRRILRSDIAKPSAEAEVARKLVDVPEVHPGGRHLILNRLSITVEKKKALHRNGRDESRVADEHVKEVQQEGGVDEDGQEVDNALKGTHKTVRSEQHGVDSVENCNGVAVEISTKEGLGDKATVTEPDSRKENKKGSLYAGIHGDDSRFAVFEWTDDEQTESRTDVIPEMNIDRVQAKVHANASVEVIDKLAAQVEDNLNACNGKSNQIGEEECFQKEDTRLDARTDEEHGNEKMGVEDNHHVTAKEEIADANSDNKTSTGEDKDTQNNVLQQNDSEIGIVVENGSWSDGFEQRMLTSTPDKEGQEVAASGDAGRRNSSIARKRSALQWRKCEEEVRFEKRVTRSASARHKESAEDEGKNVSIAAKSGSHEYARNSFPQQLVQFDVEADKRISEVKLVDHVDNSTVTENELSINGLSYGADHCDPAEVMKYEEKIKIEKKRNVKCSVLTGTGVSGSVKKKIKEGNISAVNQTESSSAITDRDDTEPLDSEGAKFEIRTSLRRGRQCQGAKFDPFRKKQTESEHQKRVREPADAISPRKKTKTQQSNSKLELAEKSPGKKLTGKKCGTPEKSMQIKRQIRSSKVDRSGSATRGIRRANELPENKQDASDAEGDSDSSPKKRGRSSGGVSVVLRKRKNMGGEEEVCSLRKDRVKKKALGRKVGARNIPKHTPNVPKTKCLRKSRSNEVDSKSLSWQAGPAKVKSPNGKTWKPSGKKSSSPCKEKSEPTGLAERKQKLCDRIKRMLISFGWKIDLRPRNGRNYMDQVYVSPKGTGYWSITKAYYVLLSDMELKQHEQGKSRNTSNSSPCNGTPPVFSPIPEELLSMLKKNMVKKRRSKLELAKLKKKKAGTAKKFKGSKRNAAETKGISKKGKKCSSSRKKRGCALLVRGSNQETGNNNDSYVPYEWKRTIFSWMIDSGILSLNTTVKYMDQSDAKVSLDGLVTREGINCGCCSKILPAVEFVTHASGEVCQPYRKIFVEESGNSLLDCLLSAWDKQSDSERQAFFPVNIGEDDPSDDTCGICGDGGDLICCDGCPSTFHMNCLGIQALPADDWRCANCSCRFCGNCSSPVVENGVEVCLSLLACSQCEEKFHQACAPEMNSMSFDINHPDKSFCTQSCRELFEGLHKLLGVKNDLDAGFSVRIVRRYEGSPGKDFGLDQKAECNSKIAVALAIMDECFLPIIDQRSSIDLIRNVVYSCGSNFARLDFCGFYTFILERGDEIICAASLRIHGTKLAEMPFIGTRSMYRRQGMCRRLLNGIESILCSLKVKKLIIPAISELVDTWTNSFGFSSLEGSHKQEVRSISMLVFPGTGLLQKPLSMNAATGKSKTLTRKCNTLEG